MSSQETHNKLDIESTNNAQNKPRAFQSIPIPIINKSNTNNTDEDTNNTDNNDTSGTELSYPPKWKRVSQQDGGLAGVMMAAMNGITPKNLKNKDDP
jgi:hypothetical protein